MSSKITLDELSISGFRAFLEMQSFKLREKGTIKSLAVFAPNAKGKSSLVDALEFFLSNDGTLKRIGRRSAGTHAGPQALEHVRARKKGVAREVAVRFFDGKEEFGDTRKVLPGGGGAIPNSAQRVCKARKIEFIIRGHELRRFVEDDTAQDRYKDVSEWFSLSSLLQIQQELRALRIDLKRSVDSTAEINERLKDLGTLTDEKLKKWNEPAVLAWVNGQIEALDKDLALPELTRGCEVYKTLTARKKREEKLIGLTAIEEALSASEEIYKKDVPQEDGTKKDEGLLIQLEKAVEELAAAGEKEQEEKKAAEKSVFKEIWEASEKLLKTGQVLSVCPVCDTAIEKTEKGSQEHIADHIESELAGLTAYREASEALSTAKTAVQAGLINLRSAVGNLGKLLKGAGYNKNHQILKTVEPYGKALSGWKVGTTLPDASDLKAKLVLVQDELKTEKKRIEDSQGAHTYGKLFTLVDNLIELKEKIEHILEKKLALKKLHSSLDATEKLIAAELRGYLQAVLDKLKDRINELFRNVHPDASEAPAIRLEMVENAKQPQLDLLVDFAPNREGVLPSGYLSDSQMHTLALSLRLAAIQMANTETPIIVLDDVVTSYDADHRKAIATLLAKEFLDFQIILVTHDEQFFCYLQDHLPKKSWLFKRITALEIDYGPRFHDHQVTDEMIKKRWANGESAANDIRQAEEDWLTTKAREFGVAIRIREVHHAYKYDRGELALALQKFLIDSKVEVPKVEGISNPFLVSLQKGDVENFGSHFNINPSAWKSEGDEKKRWQEFQEFCALFVCIVPGCDSKRFKRPKVGMKRAVCYKCETPFKFALS